jgi:hypothetical protein
MYRRAGLVLTLFVALLIVMFGLGIAAACGGGDSTDGTEGTNPDGPTGTAAATVTVTPTPTSEEEVLAVYARYWEAYGQAVLNLDAGLVDGVVAGQQLQLIRDEIKDLSSKGLAVRVVVQHNPAVINVSGDSAIVFDTMVNNTFYVDAQTKQPPAASGSGEVLRDTFFLERVNGVWVVMRSNRQR